MSDKEKKEQAAEVQEQTETQKIESTIDFQEELEPQVQEVSSLHDDDEKRTGIKDVAVDEDAMAIEKEKAKDTGGKGAIPSFFIEKSDRRRLEVDILSSKEDGKIMSVSRSGMGLDFAKDFDYLRHDRAWFEFTVPSYEDMSTYRQRCAIFRKEVGQMLVDRLQLRNFMLVWHLKDWSLIDKAGNKVELKHDEDGSLNDESLKNVYSVHPTILDIVLTIFEKDILLT